MAQATLLSPWRREDWNFTPQSTLRWLLHQRMWRRCAPPRIKAVQCYTTHTMWHRASARMWPRVMRWNDIAPTLQRCAPLPLEQLEALKTDTMGLMATNTCRTSIWPRPINQGQDFIDLGIVQIAELFTLRCDQTLSVSVSPKSYHNIRWITAVQGHVKNFFIFWFWLFPLWLGTRG